MATTTPPPPSSKRRYQIYEETIMNDKFRGIITEKNNGKLVDSYLGRMHDYNRSLYTATDLSDLTDEKIIDTYQSFLSGTGSFNSSNGNYNPDFPVLVDFDYNHKNAPTNEWDKKKLHQPLTKELADNKELKDHPYRGHPNLQVQPENGIPSQIFNPENDWVAAQEDGILPPIDPKTDGVYGIYNPVANEINASRESIGKYFSNVYDKTSSDNVQDYQKKRILGKSTI